MTHHGIIDSHPKATAGLVLGQRFSVQTDCTPTVLGDVMSLLDTLDTGLRRPSVVARSSVRDRLFRKNNLVAYIRDFTDTVINCSLFNITRRERLQKDAEDMVNRRQKKLKERLQNRRGTGKVKVYYVCVHLRMLLH